MCYHIELLGTPEKGEIHNGLIGAFIGVRVPVTIFSKVVYDYW